MADAAEDLDGRLRCALDAVSVEWRSQHGLRDAAVLAPLVRLDGEEHLLLTQRRRDLKTHGGEMSFPGGGREPDEDALACALRETEEEIGLAPDAVEVLGRLPDVQSRARFQVACFVGRSTVDTAALTPDPAEVEAIVPIAVDALQRTERWTWRDWKRTNGVIVRIPYFEHGDYLLWGMTGLLVQALLRRMRPA